MRRTPDASRAAFVALWCAIAVSLAVLSLGVYLTTVFRGASVVISGGAVALALCSRSLRRNFGAAEFANGAVRARALAGFIASVVVWSATIAVFVVNAFGWFGRGTEWWAAPLSVVLFVSSLTSSVLGYRFGLDYPKRDRLAAGR